MPNNILTEWLGLDLVELKKQTELTEEARKELAVAITKLTEYPEWTVFAAELQRMLEAIDKPCEVYANNPDLAKHDAGQKRSVQIIQSFVRTQQQLVEKYAKEKEETNNPTG